MSDPTPDGAPSGAFCGVLSPEQQLSLIHI